MTGSGKDSSFLHSLQEEVVDLFPDERPQSEELAVDSVQHCLEEVPLARVLRVNFIIDKNIFIIIKYYL